MADKFTGSVVGDLHPKKDIQVFVEAKKVRWSANVFVDLMLITVGTSNPDYQIGKVGDHPGRERLYQFPAKTDIESLRFVFRGVVPKNAEDLNEERKFEIVMVVKFKGSDNTREVPMWISGTNHKVTSLFNIKPGSESEAVYVEAMSAIALPAPVG